MLVTSIFIKEIKNHFIKVLLILLFIIPVNESFKLLGQVSSGNLSYMALLDLMIYGTLAAFPMVLTIAAFSAVTIATTNYCRNHYFIIYFTSGISLFTIARNILMFLLPLSMVCLLCSFFITPWAVAKSDQYTKYLQNKYDTTQLTEGTFKSLPYTNNVYYIESQSADKSQFENVFIEYSDNKNNIYNITAQSAIINTLSPQKIVMKLIAGNRDQVYATQPRLNTLEFASATLTVIPQYNMVANDDVRAYSAAKVLHGFDQPYIKSEFIWRCSLGIMLITISILAFPISMNLKRHTNNRHFVFIPLLYGIYQNILYVIRGYTSNNYLHSVAWAFLLHGLVLMISLLLTFIKSKPKT